MSKKENQKDSLKRSFITPLSTEEKEKDLQTLMNKVVVDTPAAAPAVEDEKTGKEKHRVTLDLSKSLAQKVKIEAAKRDLTLKGFIVELMNRYFDEKERK